jgi:hypothetical protein
MMPSFSSSPRVNSANTAGHLVFGAANTAAGLTPAWTWSAIGTLITLIGVSCVVVFRRRDTRIKELQPGYDALGKALTLLDRIAASATIASITAEVTELRDSVSALTTAEARSPKIPFGLVVAELNNYLASALPLDFAARIAADAGQLDTYLVLARMQGMKLQATRQAIMTVQRKIEKLTRN